MLSFLIHFVFEDFTLFFEHPFFEGLLDGLDPDSCLLYTSDAADEN